MMKTKTLLLIGAAALGVYLLTRKKKPKPQPQTQANLTPEQEKSVKQITDVFQSGGFRMR